MNNFELLEMDILDSFCYQILNISLESSQPFSNETVIWLVIKSLGKSYTENVKQSSNKYRGKWKDMVHDLKALTANSVIRLEI